MRLVSISVENYRSITHAYKIRIGRSTVLVGPNNEGKSNVLRALVAAMNVLIRERHASNLGASRNYPRRSIYDWERDYPVGLQSKKPNGESRIRLEFALNTAEITEFRREIKSGLNGNLPLIIAMGRARPTVTVAKRGRGGPALTKKSAQIAAFVADRLQFEHIPAVRTASSAQQIVEELVARELSVVEADPEYIAALSKIAEIQQPILSTLSRNIKDTLLTFLPDVTDVKVSIPEEERFRALRRACSIIVDDGTPTPLQLKGDGVQSLAALAIMRHASESTAKGKNVVIAIEEPESHLHPNAVHELRSVLDEMSSRHQIVLTTHNPLFVDRSTIRGNIVVFQNQARAAKSIEEVRDILGVRASDNLRNAELVLVVEGECDRSAITGILRAAHPSLVAAVSSGVLAIDTLAGGTNLSYKLSQLRSSLCLYHCFLDDDSTGRDAFEKARAHGLITDGETHFSSCPGLSEAELEDLYAPSLYGDLLLNAYGVSVDSPAFKGTRKWSERLRDTFKSQGKLWNDRVESSVKGAVSELAAKAGTEALHPARRSSFDALVGTLERRLGALGRGSS